ncbi:DUF1878 family protein [Bacillus massilinigeriensis]|uniref:DUF1878 family protein n=1 Tax=Bacillus massilionigeriensis TaxID=1805475 RepID=UPI00096AEF0F|nr:DUF1878 family protein [Bacillus massilionigeriensis]
MDVKDIIEKMNRMEYHQSLLINMISTSTDDFYKLVIKRSLDKAAVDVFFQNCANLSIKLEEQKAEGFVFFHPLFEEFKSTLHPNLQAEEVIPACIRQQLFAPLMEELEKYL